MFAVGSGCATDLKGAQALPDVLILVGSPNDLDRMAKAGETLRDLGLTSQTHVASAHRDPERVADLVQGAETGGEVKVIIAAAGMAAHLAGAVAARTVLPVIGVPLGGSAMSGVDALYSTVQMPRGIPVATVAIDGAVNAAILAAQIIGLSRPEIHERLHEQRREAAAQARAVSAGLASDKRED
jgi:5-(carboxyamino)imidazole ribonucleotide mutase